MNYFLRLVYPIALYSLVPVIILAMIIRAKWHKMVVYVYPLTSQLIKNNIATNHPYKKIFFILRVAILLLLAFLIAKPQLVDSHSKVNVEGIDMIVSIDVSGSMQIQDDQQDQRSRVEIAKAEAIHFIQKRSNDAIGLVIFGADAVSRCPLTLDKTILKTMVNEIAIGIIPPDGTVLCTALITAINRLKNSKSKSKVIILLTDGEPSQGDIAPQVAIDAAKSLGIKVYTVGIGSDQARTIRHPLYGLMELPRVNSDLLSMIANQTGGKFFMARSAKDMRDIYDTIDTLEKTEIETPVFSSYWDIFVPIVWIIFGLIMFELVLSAFVWFSL
ncbi:MAG: VWA domain-containing protein [Candidatus Babeliales bacterium]|nr:VWA domain-containing protein [Candidatus Babeliales bacterium]